MGESEKFGVLLIPARFSECIPSIEATFGGGLVVDARTRYYGVKGSCAPIKVTHSEVVEAKALKEGSRHWDEALRVKVVNTLRKKANTYKVVYLVGGPTNWRTNHLAYYYLHELYKAEVPCHLFNGLSAIPFEEEAESIPYGGDFSGFNPPDLGTVEGRYFHSVFESMLTYRVSPNFILRDFMFVAESWLNGCHNVPDRPEQVFRSSKALAHKVLDPLISKFGPLSITYGYQNRLGMEYLYSETQKKKPTSSTPHHWDRGTFGDDVYARVDILPYAVESGDVSKREYARWAMFNLDIDLLMQWKDSDVMCITVSPKPRRVWLEWVPKGEGAGGSNKITYMGENFWGSEVHSLEVKPKFMPSHTGGKMWWGKS